MSPSGHVAVKVLNNTRNLKFHLRSYSIYDEDLSMASAIKNLLLFYYHFHAMAIIRPLAKSFIWVICSSGIESCKDM